MDPNTQPSTTARARALFSSDLAVGLRPSRAELADAVDHAVRRYGADGCLSIVAFEYGDHPDAAAERMRWALDVVRPVIPKGVSS
jgi:hypothetical protein